MHSLIEVIQIMTSLKNAIAFYMKKKRPGIEFVPSPLKIYQYRLQINCTQSLLHCY